MTLQDMVNAAQAKAAELQTQIDQLTAQITSLTQQRDLHSAAAASIQSITDEQRAAIDNLIQENTNV